MAEAAGLVLGAVGVAGLFTTCIECFDIVVAGKNFSEDYEQLCALFSLQRARFGLWGESVGLIPNPIDGYRLRYDQNIDRPDIKPGIERILNNIKALLDDADRVDDRYGLQKDQSQSSRSEVMTSHGIDIFKGSFDRFKRRIRKHQKQTSAWKVTRWAIHDADKFESMINRLEKFVDGLEKITASLGLLEQQHARLQEEIESISDIQSLRLLRDASSGRHSSQNDVSDTASRRLVNIAESIIEQRTIASASVRFTITDSFVTAKTKPSATAGSLKSEEPPIPGAWPKSIKSETQGKRSRAPPSKIQHKGTFKPALSCTECLKEHYKCVPKAGLISCSRCIQTKRECSFLRDRGETIRKSLQGPAPEVIPSRSSPRQELPQNQRLLSELIEKAKPRKPLSFAAGDTHYGDNTTAIKAQNEAHWVQHSGTILALANSGSSAAKRMFLELRNIRQGKVPFVSATPLDDRLDRILASIEGPPETPYEGGVFWITVRLSKKDPFGPPLMRFHTKIYHPNISPQGHICADYRDKWSSFLSAGSYKVPVKDQDALWYRTKSTDIQWSLGALLTALCGLLATPDVDDPLVPEVAQKYLEDYDGYCENAKLYTQRYATGERPREADLYFLDEPTATANSPPASTNTPSWTSSESNFDRVSLQASLREHYDDKAPFERPGRASSPISWNTGSSVATIDPRDGLYIATELVLGRYLLHANYFQHVDLAELTRMIRRNLPSSTSDSDNITDLEISRSLLEWVLVPLQLYYQELGFYTRNFYEKLQIICAEHISASIGKAWIFPYGHSSGETIKYRIAIALQNTDPYFWDEPAVTPYWQFSKTLTDFYSLSKALEEQVPRNTASSPASISSPYHYTMHLAPLSEDTDPFIIAPQLENWLNSDVLQTRPFNILLQSRTFVEWIAQDNNFVERSHMRPLSSHNSTCPEDHAFRALHTIIPPILLSGTVITRFKFKNWSGERVRLYILQVPGIALCCEDTKGVISFAVANIQDIRAGADAKQIWDTLGKVSNLDESRYFSIYYTSDDGWPQSLHLFAREDYVQLWVKTLKDLHGCLGS